jgi:hypothetical protein
LRTGAASGNFFAAEADAPHFFLRGHVRVAANGTFQDGGALASVASRWLKRAAAICPAGQDYFASISEISALSETNSIPLAEVIAVHSHAPKAVDQAETQTPTTNSLVASTNYSVEYTSSLSSLPRVCPDSSIVSFFVLFLTATHKSLASFALFTHTKICPTC